jgi:hypothetical protein
MKLALSILGILISSATCFATTEDDETTVMYHALIPRVALNVGYSELGGKSQATPAGQVGLGYRFLRDGYFFTPAANFGVVSGFNGGSVSYWSVGFIAGGHLDFLGIDVFTGVDYQTFTSYFGPPVVLAAKTLVDGTPIYKIGAIINVGASGIQLVLSAFYGQFTQHVTDILGNRSNIYYPYSGGEVALQFPMNL